MPAVQRPMKDDPVVDVKSFGSWHPSRKGEWLGDQTHQSPEELILNVNFQSYSFLKPGGRWPTAKELPAWNCNILFPSAGGNLFCLINASFTADKQLRGCCGDIDTGTLPLGDVKFDEVCLSLKPVT